MKQWIFLLTLLSVPTLGQVTSVSVTPANGVSGTVANPTTTPAISLSLSAITPTQIGNTFYVDGFPASCTVASVSYTTQTDCAFYSAKAYTLAHNISTEVVLGAGYYQTNGLTEPTGLYAVNLKGCGIFCSYIAYAGSSGSPMIYRADGGSNFAFLQITDMSLDGGALASSIMDLGQLNSSYFINLGLQNILPNSDHYAEFGFSPGDAFQQHLINVGLGTAQQNPSTFARVTANVVGGSVTSYTVTSGGAGYNSAYNNIVQITGFQGGVSSKPCTVMPTATATISGGAVTAVTPVVSGSGCTGTVDVQVYPAFPVNYGIVFNASDSTMDDVYVYVGTKAGIQFNAGNVVTHHLHPALIPIGIQNNENNVFEGTELDSIYKYGFDLEGTAGVAIYGTNGYAGNRPLPGSAAYYLGSGAGYVNIGSQSNLCAGTKPSDWHEFVTQSGTADTSAQMANLLSNLSVLGNDQACATGGDYSPNLTVGSNVYLNQIHGIGSNAIGVSSYVVFAGGFDVPPTATTYNGGYTYWGASNQTEVDSNGLNHQAGSSPTVSHGTITGSNEVGYVSGLSAVTSLTLTFSNSGWNTWASCTANTSVSSILPYISSISKTAITFSMSALTGTLYYRCGGN